MKKFLTSLLAVLMSLTICVINIAAEDDEEIKQPVTAVGGVETVTITIKAPEIGATSFPTPEVECNFKVSEKGLSIKTFEWQFWDSNENKWVPYKIVAKDVEEYEHLSIEKGKYRISSIIVEGFNGWQDFKYKINKGSLSSSRVSSANNGKWELKADQQDKAIGVFITDAVAPAKTKVDKPTANADLVYTGNTVVGVNAPASDAAYTIENNEKVDAGTYKAVAKLKNTTTHEWADETTADVEIEYTIAKATISEVTIKEGKQEYEKDGEKLVGPNKADLVVKAGNIELDADDYNVEGNKDKTPGQKTLTVTAKDNTNFKDGEEAVTATYTIVEPSKDVEILMSDVKIADLTYNNGRELTAKIEGLSLAEEKGKHGKVILHYHPDFYKDEVDPKNKVTGGIRDAGDYICVITLDPGYVFVEKLKKKEVSGEAQLNTAKKDDTLEVHFKVNKAVLNPSLQSSEVRYNNRIDLDPVVLPRVNAFDVKYYLNEVKKANEVAECNEPGNYLVVVSLKKDA